MMAVSELSTVGARGRALATNKVIRNTYILLSLTLLFSAVMAGVAMTFGIPRLHPLMVLGIFMGLLFVVEKTRNSGWGLFWVFVFTGFMGLMLGPMLGYYLSLPNGEQIVMTAFAGTAAIFVGLSFYALSSRRDFSFMGGFLMTGILVAVVASLVAWFFTIPALSIGVSAIFVLLMSGLILWETSNLIHGGETNYISATVTLYVSIYNLFTSLLHLLGVFGDE